MKKNELYEQAIDCFGVLNQSIVAIEELAELQKELTKYMREKGDKTNLAEEIADVEIILEQVKIMYEVNPKQVENIKRYKLEKLERLIVSDIESCIDTVKEMNGKSHDYTD